MPQRVVTVTEMLDGQVALDIQCLDRVYLNAYVPTLQTSAQVVAFLSQHLGYPFPSPALFKQIGDRFRRAVTTFVTKNNIPWVRFGKNDVGGKLELMRPHLDRQAATGRSGIAAIRLGAGVITVFCQRWFARLPLPFTDADRDAGYWWETSMRQIEISRTLVFDAPRHARGFFEALIADNLDLGRPHNVEIIFNRRIRKDTKGVFRTAIDRRDNGGVIVNAFYKHSRIKQYLKDGRAMRIETVINAPRDLGCNARLPNLDDLQSKARAVNRRILDAERVGQGCVLASPAFERIAHPTVDAEGRRTPALRFGDPRVMALTGALCQTLLAATGFTNKNLRVLIAGLLGTDYRPGQMTYDLRRLRLTGLIQRLPHTNRYTLTDNGIRIAIFYTKIYNRLLIPLTAADQPQAPPELRQALHTLDHHVDDYINHARLKPAA